MKPADLNRSIAQATGESVATIQHLGFQLIDPHEPSSFEPEDSLPQFIDWDEREDRYWLARFEQAARSRTERSPASVLSCFSPAVDEAILNEPVEPTALVLPGTGEKLAYV